MLTRNGGGLERGSNFEWRNGSIRTAAMPPVIDSLALPFHVLETADGYFPLTGRRLLAVAERRRGCSDLCENDVRRSAQSLVWPLPYCVGPEGFFQNDPILINRTPQPEFATFDRHNDLIEKPDVTELGLTTAQTPSNGTSKLCNPPPDRFVGHVDAPLQKHFLHFRSEERRVGKECRL